MQTQPTTAQERAARHRRPLDEVRSLPNPDGAGQNKDGTQHTPGDSHERQYARHPEPVCPERCGTEENATG